MNIPNWITLTRILVVPVFIALFYLPQEWARLLTAGLFAAAAITDWFDGYLARCWNQTSHLGAFLDPVADKLIVVVAIILITGERDIPYFAIPSLVIIGREIIVSALREWMSELGKRTSVAVSYIGKIKTFLQMFSLILLIAFRPEQNWLGLIGLWLFYAAAILTLWSMVLYLKAAWPEFRLDK